MKKKVDKKNLKAYTEVLQAVSADSKKIVKSEYGSTLLTFVVPIRNRSAFETAVTNEHCFWERSTEPALYRQGIYQVMGSPDDMINLCECLSTNPELHSVHARKLL
jgi:hypothetical protein